MSTEFAPTASAPAPTSGAESLSIDQAVAELQAAPVESEKEEAASAEQAEPGQDAATFEEASGEAGSDADSEAVQDGDDADDEGASSEDGEQQPAKAVKPPASWAKDAQEAFAKLPPDLQEVVAAREKERESFANTKAQEAAQARKEREELLTFATQEVTKTLRMAQDAIEGEFAGIDWTTLQASDPTTFLQLDAMRKQRLEKIMGLQQQREALSAEQERVNAAQAQAALQEEAAKVLPVLKELVGESFTPAQFQKDVGTFLETSGVPKELIGKIQTGWELTIATKAMLFDKMQAAKTRAAQKVASAPRVQKPGSKPMVAEQGHTQKIKAASARLDKTGSIDDAVALLRAASRSQ
jgi:hypothetical protein